MKFIVSHRVFYFFLFLFFSDQASAQIPPKRELRGAWIATYSNIDFPVKGQTPQQQQEHFIRILDHHKSIGINTIYVQVRSQGDAFYASEIEPWSADLTGIQGQAPSPWWDPLTFMIDEAHKRGMEFHAWLNPYRAVGNVSNLPTFSPQHVAKKNPEWLLRFGTLYTLNPGLPEVRQYILKIVSDIANRYDVDGIHFDDYFYPDPTVNDNAAWNKYKGEFSNKSDWRRNNVDLLIENVNSALHKIKPWVKFGVSPSGIYRNSMDPAIGTQTTGLEHYTYLFSDTKKWLEKGWVDYIEPQVYWSTLTKGSRYGDIVPWWNSIANGRHIYIGMAGYKVAPGGPSGWGDKNEIPRQVIINRNTIFSNIKGHAFYNTSSMLQNPLGFSDSLRKLFEYPSLQPLMPWRDSIAPEPPYSLSVSHQSSGFNFLSWQVAPSLDEMNRPTQFVVYSSLNSVIDFNDPRNIIAITNKNEWLDKRGNAGAYYAVTSLDRLHNESEPSNIAVTGKTSIPFSITDIKIIEKGDELIIVWSVAEDKTATHFFVEKSVSGAPYKIIDTVLSKREEGIVQYEISDGEGGFEAVTYRITGLDNAGYKTVSRAATFKRNVPDTVTAGQPVVKNEFPVQTSPVPEVKIIEEEDEQDFPYIIQPFKPLRSGAPLTVTVLVAGEVPYVIYDAQNNKITWGKMRSQRSGTRVSLPGTNSLVPGLYKIVVESGEYDQEETITVI